MPGKSEFQQGIKKISGMYNVAPVMLDIVTKEKRTAEAVRFCALFIYTFF